MKRARWFGAALLLLLMACSSTEQSVAPKAKGESPEQARLRNEIGRMDEQLSEAFNRHDLEQLMTYFTDDLEFFHDKGGLQHNADVRSGFQSLFAKNNAIRRELVAGSSEVYPIPDYGALQVGAHTFCHREDDGRQECATFKFVTVWKKSAAGWKMSRVMSYDHRS